MIDPLSVLSVVAGLIYLVMGGDLLIRGSISTARRFNVPPAVVGATLVALGTSLPELIVSLLAATTDHAGLALGNVVGSNTLNILIVIGVTSLVADLPVGPRVLDLGIWFMLGASLVLAAFVLSNRAVGRVTGAIFLLAYLPFVWLVF